MISLYAATNFSTLVGLASPDPLANMYDRKYFRATWVLTALDAGFWTAMKIRPKWLRDLSSLVFSVWYMYAADQADEKVRKVRGNLTVQHLRVSWNKGTTPYLRFFQGLLRPRFSRWPARFVRIPRPTGSDYSEPVAGWLYYDGSLEQLERLDISKVVLDLPGGGFVAMDPRCNDDRLFSWAARTGLPILSLDYKKAPEYPYPYALNEIYDVYVTLVRSRGKCLGLSGKQVPRIVVTGDSAGGNLAASMTLMVAENATGRMHLAPGQAEIPMPDGLILFYPGLDMNIGNWMSDQQMSLIKDRRVRTTNKNVIKQKSMQYSELAKTPHVSDDEDGGMTPDDGPPKPAGVPDGVRSPAPEFSHSTPTTFGQGVQSPSATRPGRVGTSYRPEPLHTRLAMSSMISYFNDRILTPEMMRAMIILYVGPRNRPDFSQDYHLSPILAPDLLLARFPKTYFLTGERDPLVDDTLIFAGRLRRVKAALHASGGRRYEYQDSDAQADGFNDKDVADVALIPGISHGFLQFPTVYPPAWKLIDRAAKWIEDAFASAELRAAERRQLQVGGTRSRHHTRTESSGDEGKMLEIGMMRLRRQNATPSANAAEESPASSNTTGANSRARRNARRKAERNSDDSVMINKLPSSDDLLGRRMNGLVGGLTGIEDD